MPVAAPNEGYFKMIAYGRHKTELRWNQILLQAAAAGVWIAIIGHCCTVFASSFYSKTDLYSPGLTRLAYGMMFPGAFIAVVYTGTELFTGNTVTMFMLLFNDGRKVLIPLARIWSLSLLGNFCGASGGAFLLSYCSGAFKEGSRAQSFLFSIAKGKDDNTFFENMVLGFGCNAMVCLATWCVVVTDDGAGKIMAVFYAIGLFAMGGLEHVVANFYTLSAAHFCGFKKYHYVSTMWRNWLPVLIGNMLAGTLFTGALWWYALHPQMTSLAPFSAEELATELTKRIVDTDMSRADLDATPGIGMRWQKPKDVLGSFMLAPQFRQATPRAPGTDYSAVLIDPCRSGSGSMELTFQRGGEGSVRRPPRDVSVILSPTASTAQPSDGYSTSPSVTLSPPPAAKSPKSVLEEPQQMAAVEEQSESSEDE